MDPFPDGVARRRERFRVKFEEARDRRDRAQAELDRAQYEYELTSEALAAIDFILNAVAPGAVAQLERMNRSVPNG
jgi:hypothetical protein